MNLDAPLTPADAEALFEIMLRRPLHDTAYRDLLVAQGSTLRDFVTALRLCDELRERMRDDFRREEPTDFIDPVRYRCPSDLVATAAGPRRVILIGSCLLENWGLRLADYTDGCKLETYLLGGALPERPQHPVGDYDFQVVQLPLRSLVGDTAFARLAQADAAGHQALFDQALSAMRFLLARALRWTREAGLATFVMPVFGPQQNSVGRLMPRYTLRNPVFFHEKLNEAIAREVAAVPNAWFFDLNELVATHGRRFVQEDAIAQTNHGGLLGNFDHAHDHARLEAAVRATALHEERVQSFAEATWAELVALFRTLRQTDLVKLVVIDLDDTLWRGTIAETPPEAMPTTEGWPTALWETLLFLKRRGILLGIISRNDPEAVAQAFPAILRGQLTLADFAAVRINYAPKSANMGEILSAVNLQPGSVVYIDDNPTQRAEMAAAWPDIRILSGNPVSWRRILLWSAETQVPQITAVSGQRTAMVQAQQVREAVRAASDPADFRAGLDVRLRLFALAGGDDPRFGRTLELINKTNQFNTTGERWTREQCLAAIAEGHEFHAFELTDRFTGYGLVGVLITDRDGIRQFVMSCRVMGLDAEIAAVAAMLAIFAGRGRPAMQARLVETERNLPCRDIYARCGFQAVDGGWRRATAPPLATPSHIVVAGPRLAVPAQPGSATPSSTARR